MDIPLKRELHGNLRIAVFGPKVQFFLRELYLTAILRYSPQSFWKYTHTEKMLDNDAA